MIGTEYGSKPCTCEAGISRPNILRSVEAHRWSATEEDLLKAKKLIDAAIEEKRRRAEAQFQALVSIRICKDEQCGHASPRRLIICLGHAEILKDKLEAAIADVHTEAQDRC